MAQGAEDGLPVECRQLKSKEGLERITGLLSVVAVRLLQLKSAARTNPDRPAGQVVPLHWIKMLIAVRKRLKNTTATTMTIGEFYRELAKLGVSLDGSRTASRAGSRFGEAGRNCTCSCEGAELAKRSNKCG